MKYADLNNFCVYPCFESQSASQPDFADSLTTPFIPNINQYLNLLVLKMLLAAQKWLYVLSPCPGIYIPNAHKITR